MSTLTTSYQLLGSKYVGTSGGSLYIRVYAKYSEQDITNNKTKVQYQARAYYENSTYIYDQSGNGSVSGTSASTVSGSCTRPTTGETTIATTEGWVSHNSDGTMSITASATLNFPNWGWSATASGDATLPTIPRATSCPNLDGYIESSAPISLNPASSSFKHRLYYSYNGKTGYYPSSTEFFVNTGSLTLDTSFYSYTPKSSGTGSLTLYTYDSSGNEIGSKTGTITVRCDKEKCKPTITAEVVDINETTKALTGDSTKLIKGYSNAQITYTINVKNSSTLKNKTVNGSTLGTSPHTIYGVSTEIFSIVAIDSRDFDTTEIKTSAMVDYIPLTLDFTAYRPTPTGSEIKINFQGNYFDNSFGSVSNTLTLSWKYRIKGSGEWIDGGVFEKDTDYTVSNNRFSSIGDISLSDSLFDYQNNYEIGVFYADKLINNSVFKIVTKGEPILSWEDNLVNANGKFMSKKHNIYFLGVLGAGWVELGTFLFDSQGQTAIIDCYTGDGQNGHGLQNTHMRIILKQGWTVEELPIGVSANFLQMYKKDIKVRISHLSKTECKLYVYLPFNYNDFNYIYNGTYKSFTPSNVSLSEEPVTDKEATYFKVVDTSPISLNINTEYVYSSDLNVTCFQIGNYVFLDMNVIAFNQEVPHLGVIMTGLPIPKKSEHCYIYGGMGSTTTREASRLLLDTNGELMLWHSIVANYGESSNRQYSGILVYEVAD